MPITLRQFMQGATSSTTNTLPLERGGTNAITAPAARLSLGAAAAGANTDITSINGIVIGKGTGTSYTNTALGLITLSSNTTGTNNTGVGFTSLYANTTGYNNTAAGYGTLQASTTGYNNTAFGRSALFSNITGYGNTAVGSSALNTNGAGIFNTAIGFNTLGANEGGVANTAIGSLALSSSVSANSNTAVGYYNLNSNTTGTCNSSFGREGLYFNTTGSFNTASGFYSLVNNTTGANNTASGAYALFSNATSSNSTAVGHSALRFSTGVQNTAVGALAAYEITTGTNNTAIGYNTGRGITTGSGNTVLGSNVTGLAAALTNNIIIANSAGAVKAQHDGTNWTFTGNVGIGTTAPVAKLHVFQDSASTSNMSGVYIQNSSFTANTQSGIGLFSADNYNAKIFTLRTGMSNGDLIFATNGGGGTGEINVAERMRLDSAGKLNVNTTGLNAIIGANNVVGVTPAFAARTTITTGTGLFEFINPNGMVGSVTVSGSSAAYNTSSDYRLKETITPMIDALSKVSQLKPCTYTWKVDGSAGQGFIAHELATVAPGCVTGEKDAVDAEGKPQYQGIDTSFLVATLTAAIQELKALVDSQASRIAALETKPAA